MSMPSGARGTDVSIVIPVFNKLELTKVCIDSIHEVGSEASFEIIVVDNGSSDGSPEWLAAQQQQGRLKLVINPDNLGFSRGCNVGAEAATGRYLLFLNNDMKVLDGWLDPLVSTLERDPEVGVVGAKLLYPDNTIQHAGVALVEFSQQGDILGGIHLSHRKPVNFAGTTQPMYNQIVTGACLLIRQQLFQDVNGFDERYWNGNEDVDLCLKVGQRGFKVVYRPESLIYHYESQSGPERWSQTQQNIEKFNQVWKSVAKPDYIHHSDDEITATPEMAIRNYVSPRLSFSPKGDTDDGPSVSIIVLTWNALDFTRKCAESLLAHTSSVHELLFVDNGSEPETIDYLKDLEDAHPQVRVILNGKNLGFAAGNNVGMAEAKGEYVCLLNSDVVVTEGWLEALLAPAMADPKIAMVGPVTNSISGGQKLPSVPYNEDTLEGLTEFAARRRQTEAGKKQTALMIVGFCMLIKKDLIARIGGLDEGFGQGNYEDTDYCLRALLAGFNSVVVFDSFVHHFGSRSFVEGGIDYASQIDEKFQIFRKKWSLEPTARSAANLNLEQLLRLGFIAPLHFEHLPRNGQVAVQPLETWEEFRWLAQGEAFFEKRRFDDAERIFRAVLDLNPDSLRAANNLACTLWQRNDEGDLDESVAVLEKILRQDPNNEDAQWNLKEITATAT